MRVNYRGLFLFLLLLPAFSLFLSSCGDGSDSKGGDCGTVTEIGSNSVLDGVLNSSDCEVSDLVPTAADDSYADEYLLTLDSSTTITITMRSTELDSYLVILGRSTSCASGCTVAEANVLYQDDDSGGGADAQITVTLDAGSYIIVANSYERTTGNYTIETSTVL